VGDVRLHVERSKSSRARCRTCSEPIGLNTLRIVEGVLSEDNKHVTPGYHHLACGAEHNRVRTLNAVAALETVDDLFEAALWQLEDDKDLVSQIRQLRERRAGVRPLDDDAEVQALLGELEANPGDRGLLSVLADVLQLRGEPRGELIMHDLAVSLDPAALARRRELTALLAPSLGPSGKLYWGIGFVRKVELGYGVMTDHLEKLFADPSCRLLEVLSIHRYDPRPAPVLARRLLPRSLRRIELHCDLSVGSDFSGLPYLQHVVLERATEDSLAALDRVGRITPHLTIRSYDLRREHRSRLEAVCETLVFDDHTVEEPAPPPSNRIEHANKPEWGIGTIVRELDDKIEVEFPSAGKKMFKRNAPFLRRVS